MLAYVREHGGSLNGLDSGFLLGFKIVSVTALPVRSIFHNNGENLVR